MGAASKLSMLLTTPFPFLCARPSVLRLVRHSRVSVAYFSSTSKRKFSLNSRSQLEIINVSKEFHTQTTTGVSRNDDYYPESIGFSSNSGVTHPWSEWCKLVENLGASGYFNRKQTSELGGSDAFTVFDNLPDEFVRAASACLSFARDRSELLSLLSTKDIEVVVENGSPFLFKSAIDTKRRMRSFLSKDGGNELEVERADMVDLMRFLLSYACNFPGVPEHENYNNRKHVESSVRNLLSELADASRAVQELDHSGSLPKRFPDKFGQTPRPFGKNIEMKRGDWICSKCSFMNFAKNMKCLDCKEARPTRQLTGQEWECPQCEFYNYGRNVVCLRCDCKCPGESTAGSRSDLGNSDGINLSLDDIASRISAKDERGERWFGKASYMDNDSEFNRTTADKSEIMPLRKGVNRFVVSTRKTPLERRSFNDQYQDNLDSSDGDSERSSLQAGDVNDSAKSSGTSVSQSLDRILGRSPSDSKANSGITGPAENKTGTWKSSISRSTSPPFGRSVGSNSDYVPFVPLPADMFSKPQKPKMEERESFNCDATKAEELVGSSVSDKPIDSLLLSEQPVNQAESTEDKEQAEVGNNSEYVPFVPLPADMFSEPQKPKMEEKVREKAEELVGSSVSDKPIDSLLLSEKPVNQAESTEDKEQAEKSERWFKKVAELHDVTDLASAISDEDFPDIMPMRKGENRFVVSKKKDRSLTSPLYKRRIAMEQANNTNFVPFVPFPPDYFAKNDEHSETGASIQNAKDRTETPAASTPEIQGGASVKSEERNARGPNYGAVGNSVQRPDDQNLTKRPIDLQNSGSWKESSTSNVSRSIQQNSTPEQPDNSQNRKASGFSGKSLEGSLVKEPDPLDMSEEAKAERWFRRAAQIKDISELSQIPDEDFPEIMPMRKGVNRFVVSKRKTPLERRLTSPQYRRNLPIVSSEPLKKENDES